MNNSCQCAINFSIILSVLFLTKVSSFSSEPSAPTGQLIEIARNDKVAILVNDMHPEFGWTINDDDQNEYQSAYQILVSSSLDNLNKNIGDLWDTGKTISKQSSNVNYDGLPLQSGKMYFWKVRTWDKDGNSSPYSSICRFITALQVKDWIAKPIWDASNKINQDVCDFAYFRKTLKLPDKSIKYAIAFVTSRDARLQKSPSYKFYMNNKLVGIGPFQGYADRVTYLGYDVTDYIQANSINIISAICESSLKEKDFLMQLFIQYENSDTVITTDATWKSYNAQSIYNPHGTKTSNAYHYIDPFESINSKMIPYGWKTQHFDDSRWPYARVRHHYYDRLIAVSKPPFQIEEIFPASIEYLGNGDYNLSLGSGHFGFLRIRFEDAVPGDTITIRGERDIYPWTVVDWENWILSSPSQVIEQVGYVWTDSLQIRGYKGADTLDKSNISFVAIRNPFDDKASSFSSSNELLNEIYAFCKKSMKHLNVDFYWDTPQNERLAYEGGGLIQQLTSYAMDREYALARFATEYQYHEPTWPHEYKIQSIFMGWHDYLYTGNIESIKENWEILKEKKYDVDITSNFLIENIAATALDWPPPYLDGYDYEDGDESNLFIDNVLNAWNFFAYEHLAKMAFHLDTFFPDEHFKSENKHFRKIAQAIRENYHNTFYRQDLQRFADGYNSAHAAMHSSFMPVALDMVTTDIADDLASYLESRDMDCGVFGSQFYLWSLYKLNRGNKALDLIVSTKKNSWYNMIYNLKAANVCEAWDPSGKPDMSKSHAWGSSAGNMIQRGLMGINPLEPGFNKISIKPQTGHLEFARIEVPTIKGKVCVQVTQTSDIYEVQVNIPVNTLAKVYLKQMNPSRTEVEVDGKMTNGIPDKNDEYIVIDNIGSGLHTLKVLF